MKYLILILFPFYLMAQTSTGNTAPQSAETVLEAPWEDNTWSDPNNIFGAGEASVTAASFDAGDQTYVLKAYNFDFSAIPSGSTINGVVCVINARYATALGRIDLVQILNASRAKVGTNLASSPTDLTTSAANYTFGASNNLWGNSLTASWVKDADFGVAVGCLAGGTGNNNVDVYIDSIVLNVYYTEPTGWTGKMQGVTNPAKINGVLITGISKVNGI